MKKKDGEYLAPEIKVIVIKSQGMICMSGFTDTFQNGDTTGWW